MTVEELVLLLGRALSADVRLRYALLFGSAATRGPELANDIDIAVSAHTSLGLLDRMRLATELERIVGKAVDVIDLDDASTLVRREVLRDGRPLVVNDAAAFLGFKASVPIEWADLEPYFARESAGLAKALEETRWSRSSSSATRSDG